MEDERRREEMREEQARLERRNLQSSKAANAAAALLEAELKEAMRSDKVRRASQQRSSSVHRSRPASALSRPSKVFMVTQRNVSGGGPQPKLEGGTIRNSRRYGCA